MITRYHHIELNGVKYRLDESAEGQHYQRRREPLRLQTGSVVQGESGKFQLRPDILEWSITDWSGGEGAVRFDSEEPNRYFEGHNVDPFHHKGHLHLAKGFEETNDSGDATLTKSLQLGKAINTLWGASVDSNDLYEWDSDNDRWKTSVSNGESGFGAGQWEPGAVVGDRNKLYLDEDGGTSIWSYNGSSFDEHNTGAAPSLPQQFTELASNIYITRTGGQAAVIEIPKAGTTPVTSTTILDLTDSGLSDQDGLNRLTAGNNRVYLAQQDADETVIWRITPSTASSTGFGEEILRQRGLQVETLWHHMGVLFMAGRIGTDGDGRKQVIMYLRGSEVGVLANLRDGTSTAGKICSTEAQEFEVAYFLAQYGPGDGTYEWTLFAADLITGGVAGLTVVDIVDTSSQPQTLVAHNGEVFFGASAGGSTNERTYRILSDTYVDTSVVTARLDTAINDFGLVDEKILLSIRLQTEPLPANSSVEIQYQLDQDGTWTSAGTYSTTGGAGTTFTLSTASSAITFRNLQLRLILDNGGSTSETPTILNVSTRATVAAGLNVWTLRLDLADDHGEAATERTLGREKIDNIVTAGDLETVVALKDGYPDGRVGEFTSHNVVVDDYQISLRQPGEGTALVQLREVS